jgi:large-conductance mechanosensitive channel
MRWLKKYLWNISIASVGVLFLLTCLTLLPLSTASAHGEASGVATPGIVAGQATPIVDATVTALNKEQLVHENDWWWNYGATILTSVISTLTLAAAGVFTVVRYFNDRGDTREKQEAEAKRLAEDRQAERERRDEEQQRWLKDQEAEREKRAEERFQAAVEGLSSEREEAKIGAAILLRTFLRPGYEQFYQQVFDLAVANLRLPRTSTPSELL